MKKICVFGTYKNLEAKHKDEIVRLGKLLAENGFAVVSGGFSGAMTYVSQGAKSAGGHTIGVTYYKPESDKSKKANEFIDEEIRTTNIFDRISRMMEISDGFVVLQGGTGTLLELAAILEHINKGLIVPNPIVAVGRFWKDLARNLSSENILDDDAKSLSKIPTCDGLITFVKNAEEAVSQIVKKVIV